MKNNNISPFKAGYNYTVLMHYYNFNFFFLACCRILACHNHLCQFDLCVLHFSRISMLQVHCTFDDLTIKLLTWDDTLKQCILIYIHIQPVIQLHVLQWSEKTPPNAVNADHLSLTKCVLLDANDVNADQSSLTKRYITGNTCEGFGLVREGFCLRSFTTRVLQWVWWVMLPPSGYTETVQLELQGFGHVWV